MGCTGFGIFKSGKNLGDLEKNLEDLEKYLTEFEINCSIIEDKLGQLHELFKMTTFFKNGEGVLS